VPEVDQNQRTEPRYGAVASARWLVFGPAFCVRKPKGGLLSTSRMWAHDRGSTPSAPTANLGERGAKDRKAGKRAGTAADSGESTTGPGPARAGAPVRPGRPGARPGTAAAATQTRGPAERRERGTVRAARPEAPPGTQPDRTAGGTSRPDGRDGGRDRTT